MGDRRHHLVGDRLAGLKAADGPRLVGIDHLVGVETPFPDAHGRGGEGQVQPRLAFLQRPAALHQVRDVEDHAAEPAARAAADGAGAHVDPPAAGFGRALQGKGRALRQSLPEARVERRAGGLADRGQQALVGGRLSGLEAQDGPRPVGQFHPMRRPGRFPIADAPSVQGDHDVHALVVERGHQRQEEEAHAGEGDSQGQHVGRRALNHVDGPAVAEPQARHGGIVHA